MHEPQLPSKEPGFQYSGNTGSSSSPLTPPKTDSMTEKLQDLQFPLLGLRGIKNTTVYSPFSSPLLDYKMDKLHERLFLLRESGINFRGSTGTSSSLFLHPRINPMMRVPQLPKAAQSQEASSKQPEAVFC